MIPISLLSSVHRHDLTHPLGACLIQAAAFVVRDTIGAVVAPMSTDGWAG